MLWLSYIVLNVLLGLSSSMERNTLYMKRSNFGDQASSESGYVFQASSGVPTSYSSFSDTTGNFNNFGYPPITVGRFSTQALPPVLPVSSVKYVPEAPLNLPLNSYGLPVPHSVLAQPEFQIQQHLPQSAEYKQGLLGAALSGQGAELSSLDGSKGVASGQQFAEGGGKKYSDSNVASHGKKGDSGYKSAHEYDKGAQGKHENEAHKGYYSKEGGNKASAHEVGGHYDKKDAAAKGIKGGSSSESSGHKKGSKTTGFHKVYHKDEYKKDHSFYDESDSKGHFNKYGNVDAQHSSDQGAYNKGRHSNSGYQGNTHGAKGFHDKGRYIDEGKGYKGVQGKDSYYKDFAEYDKSAGQEGSEQSGFIDGKGNSYH